MLPRRPGVSQIKPAFCPSRRGARFLSSKRLKLLSSLIRAAPMYRSLLLLLLVGCSRPTRYDLVIRGGRVMDPETGLDAVRDVGISGDRIAKISERPLDGARVIEAKGLIVAPGFI